MFCAETIAIIRGNPSGTAITIIITANMTASTIALTTAIQLEQ